MELVNGSLKSNLYPKAGVYTQKTVKDYQRNYDYQGDYHCDYHYDNCGNKVKCRASLVYCK